MDVRGCGIQDCHSIKILAGMGEPRLARWRRGDTHIREGTLLVQIFPQSDYTLTGEHAKDSSLVLCELWEEVSKKSIKMSWAWLTWRSIPAEDFEIFSEEGLYSCQAKVGETRARVQESQYTL